MLRGGFGSFKKYTAPKTPLELEETYQLIQPTDLQVDTALVQNLTKRIKELEERKRQKQAEDYDTTVEDIEVKAASSMLKDLRIAEQQKKVGMEFFNDFMNWLVGNPSERDARRTPWLLTKDKTNTITVIPADDRRKPELVPAKCDAEVAKYVDLFETQRVQNELEIRSLALRAPVGIDEFYIFYKYIVQGQKLTMANFALDWGRFNREPMDIDPEDQEIGAFGYKAPEPQEGRAPMELEGGAEDVAGDALMEVDPSVEQELENAKLGPRPITEIEVEPGEPMEVESTPEAAALEEEELRQIKEEDQKPIRTDEQKKLDKKIEMVKRLSDFEQNRLKVTGTPEEHKKWEQGVLKEDFEEPAHFRVQKNQNAVDYAATKRFGGAMDNAERALMAQVEDYTQEQLLAEIKAARDAKDTDRYEALLVMHAQRQKLDALVHEYEQYEAWQQRQLEEEKQRKLEEQRAQEEQEEQLQEMERDREDDPELQTRSKTSYSGPKTLDEYIDDKKRIATQEGISEAIAGQMAKDYQLEQLTKMLKEMQKMINMDMAAQIINQDNQRKMAELELAIQLKKQFEPTKKRK